MKLRARISKAERGVQNSIEKFDAGSFDRWLEWWESMGYRVGREGFLQTARNKGIMNLDQYMEWLFDEIGKNRQVLPKIPPDSELVRLKKRSHDHHERAKRTTDQGGNS